MAKRDNISMSVIRRLPRYYRFLDELLRSGIVRISSGELASRMGLTASQIRQDLNCFGGFGQQGYGYDVAKLFGEIKSILGVDEGYPAIMIGAGNLGRAVSIYISGSGKPRGFQLLAMFDKSPKLINTCYNGVPVLNIDDIEQFCRENSPKAVFLCIPSEGTKQLIDTLYDCGVRYFWNFSHFDIAMKYPDAVVENVHLSDSLMTLCYHITHTDTSETDS
ncbi:MAG: redox-sensing transcriptional repressor Rex [Ruminococcaceae bacterium]|nr:redox-sensing transcriptional repressor Rex [Oscillospiraceae bacterium]